MMDTQSTDVILHAFDWPYRLIAERAVRIARCGYRAVLVSPPMKSAMSEQGTLWWQRYQPQDYRVIENQLGDTHEFRRMVATLAEQDIWVYIDVVFNHMANESKQRLDLQYPSHEVLAQYQQDEHYYQEMRLFGDLSQPLFHEEDFVDAFGIRDWNDPWEVQNGRITGGPHDQGLPTLVANPHVVQQQQQYVQVMKSLGVKGFRIDAAKHMTLEHLKQVWTEELTHDVHIFGEIITDGGASHEEYQIFLQPYLQETHLAAYDFPLFQTIYNAMSPQGDLTSLVNPYWFGQALSPERAITFSITHDIPNNDIFRGQVMEEWAEALAYSYILGRDGGVPLVYSDLDSSGMTNQMGFPRWENAWQAEAMSARIDFHNRLHGLPMQMLVSEKDCLVFSRGDRGLVVLNKSGSPKVLSLHWPCPMQDMLSGRFFLCQSDMLTIEVPGHDSYMLLPYSTPSETG
ncbi:alpha-amylase family protein [Vibrio mangrovi]|uniref:Alpha-amylase n=1 Tax=Vibrio mangrovi TaxID=474394 RepID=A0A1Y6J075_9VIBR|nr:alpha-amylase family protein [Vibrio mangrovi]MDW6005139.1 alpha-amylase family protein [Vibrio mangrovi]SMS02651.1 Alpha-amylase precursor [Vibrio mangrovi]